jgi:small nuclear ribonucleoprotein (snRNP)-like protein
LKNLDLKKISSSFFPLVLLLLPAFILNSCAKTAADVSTNTKTLGNFLLDNIFLVTILFIFLSAFVTAILKERARDRCLKDFRDYPVILELENESKVIWGILSLYSNGLELHYQDSYQDPDGLIKASFILYKDEWPGLMAIYRCAQDLDDEAIERRKYDIRRTYQPSVFRRFLRFLRNLFNTLRDAVNKSVGLIVGQAKKAMPSSRILSTQDTAIKQLGETFVEYASYAYDAVLESLIGRKVVVEIPHLGILMEYVGILKEYSANFVEILSVKECLEFLLPLPPQGISKEYYHLKVKIQENSFFLKNKGKTPVILAGLTGENYEQKWEFTLDPGESTEKKMDAPPPGDAKMKVRLFGETDLILPRLRARIRHRGEIKSFDWKSFFGFK